MAIEHWRPRSIRFWLPFRQMEETEHFLDWPFRIVGRRAPTNGFSWTPAMDMYEKADKFVIRMDLPGLKKEDVDISMVENTLTIKGERKQPIEYKEEYQCNEVCYGSFSRSITMPPSVDADKIEADFENGVLEICLPKVAAAKPAKIPIKTKSSS